MVQRKVLMFLLLVGVFASASTLPSAGVLVAESRSITAYVFWQKGCPYCASAKVELERLSRVRSSVKIEAIELGNSSANEVLYERALVHFGFEQAAVPLVVIGDQPFLGFASHGRSAAAYEQAITKCLKSKCQDVIAELSSSQLTGQMAEDTGHSSSSDYNLQALIPETISVPFLGPVQTRDLSLPALTVLLAGVDGFNPCAMWVLVFLIGLLLGLDDERRMWLLGGTFLSATAVMYFAIMAAWLNLVLVLGAVAWLRLAIGALAIGVGFYFLREYWTKPEAACKVVNPGRRQKIMVAFRAIVQQERLVWAVLGMMVLAVSVNLIELLCSAGVPAVYTQILTLNDLPLATYYSYICLYIAVFMLDDIAIFATAMFALRVSGLTGSYARYSHLIGGVVLMAIGAIMALRPELLSFG
jgi:glutaredoxin